MKKNHFLLLKTFKNAESAQLCVYVRMCVWGGVCVCVCVCLCVCVCV